MSLGFTRVCEAILQTSQTTYRAYSQRHVHNRVRNRVRNRVHNRVRATSPHSYVTI